MRIFSGVILRVGSSKCEGVCSPRYPAVEVHPPKVLQPAKPAEPLRRPALKQITDGARHKHPMPIRQAYPADRAAQGGTPLPPPRLSRPLSRRRAANQATLLKDRAV